MVDRIFEMELDRQFSVSPMLPDADLFAARIAERLDRGWAFRRLLIGGLGLAGGLIGAGQLLGSGLLARMHTMTSHSSALFSSGMITKLPVARGVAEFFSAGSGADGQILWMSGALAALAVGLLVTRTIREI